jgi:hypothetical protein
MNTLENELAMLLERLQEDGPFPEQMVNDMKHLFFAGASCAFDFTIREVYGNKSPEAKAKALEGLYMELEQWAKSK